MKRLALIFAVAASPAWAAPCRGVRQRDQQLVVEAYDTGDAFPEIDAKLTKGLAVTLVSEANWEGRPGRVFGCKIYYDLWDETYSVTVVRGSLAGAGDKRTVKDRGEALKLCYTASLPAGSYGAGAFELTTHLNPVSDEVLAKTRQWLAEKGISGSSGAIFGRAAYAIIDLKQQEAVTRRCLVTGPQ